MFAVVHLSLIELDMLALAGFVELCCILRFQEMLCQVVKADFFTFLKYFHCVITFHCEALVCKHCTQM